MNTKTRSLPVNIPYETHMGEPGRYLGLALVLSKDQQRYELRVDAPMIRQCLAVRQETPDTLYITVESMTKEEPA
jgi:hypothetical protein